MFKQLLGASCAFCLSLGSVPIYAQQVSAEPNETFTEFLDEEFIESLEDDYTTLHNYLSDPESMGISYEDVDTTLGEFTYTKEDKKEVRSTIKKLKSFDRSSLDSQQQAIYDEYLSSLQLSKKMMNDKYTYLGNIWSSSSGVVSNLNNYFANFEVYNQEDIEAFITLLKDTKRYTKEAIAFSKEQAEQNTLCFDYKETLSSINTTLKNKDNNEILKNISAEIDELGLDQETAQSYKDTIQTCLEEDYYPSFTYLKKEIKALKSENLPAQPITAFDNGKEYYALLLQSKASTSKSAQTIQKELANAYTEIAMSLQDNNADIDSFSTGFTSSDEILNFLAQNYTSNMPEITLPSYDVQDLPEEQTSKSVVAYYLEPVLDREEVNRIRFNAKDFGGDTGSLDTYLTFAHEGLPGHMYQFNYNHQNVNYNLAHLFNETAYTEGFAMLAEKEALSYLDISDQQADLAMGYEALNYYLPAIMDIDINQSGYSEEEFLEQYKDIGSTSMLESLYESSCYDPAMYIPYGYGCYKMLDLQQTAQEELKDSYDNKAFMNAILENGIVNFDILDQKMDQFIKQENV